MLGFRKKMSYLYAIIGCDEQATFVNNRGRIQPWDDQLVPLGLIFALPQTGAKKLQFDSFSLCDAFFSLWFDRRGRAGGGIEPSYEVVKGYSSFGEINL